ncbi:MAG: nuclear transport factor 2 family protein [Psychroserpens sp.]|uniref:nuclear transport factor 2 family protein n=1 Tax=Psychroserpens sp. TaxID=2020870 RepID=UPI003C73723C
MKTSILVIAIVFLSIPVMAQEENTNNINIVNSLYEFFGKGDVPSVLALMHKDIVWNEAESNSLADGNPYVGPEAVLNGVFARIGAMYKSFSLKDIELHEMSNNKVLATMYYMITAKDGKNYEVQAAHFWTLNQEGKIIKFQQYADTKKLAELDRS